MNMITVDGYLNKGIKNSFLLLVFLLPLLLSTWSSEVFELPKMLFVYATAAVIVGLWLMRMAVRREILIRRTPLDIPILLFLLSQIASTIYSIDPSVSWWGWYGRFHGGLVSTISYTLLYYAFVSNFRTDSNEESLWRTPRRLLFTIMASAIIVSGYAILQHFGIDKDFWVQDVVNRVFSTQGQPNWLAAYLVMVIPLGWALIMSNEQKTENNDREGAKFSKTFIAHCFLLIIFFLALLFTKSRSGLIGLAVADAVFWLATLAKRRKKEEGSASWRRKKAKQFVLIHAIMMILILVTNNPVREWAVTKLQVTSYREQVNQQALPALEGGISLRKSELGGTESGDIRRLVWNGAVQLVKQRPVFGFGPETFGETYWRVRPREHNLTSEWNFLYNKAHNEWLNLAANTGIFGLVSHLLLLGWLSVWVLKGPALPRQGRALSSYAILAALLGVEAVNFFGFSTVTVGIYQYLFMAVAVSVSVDDVNKLLKTSVDRQHSSVIKAVLELLKSMSDRAVSSVIQDDKDGDLRKTVGGWQKTILVILILFLLYLISQISIFFLADLDYNRGRAYQDAGYIEEAVEPLMRAVNLAPEEPVFRAELAEAEGALAAGLTAQLTDNGEQETENSGIILELKNDSISNFEIVRKQSPYNLGFIRTQARVLFNMRELEPSLSEQAFQLMKQAMEMAPTNPQLPYSLGVIFQKLDKGDEAAVYFSKAVELKPDYQEAIKILNTEY